MFLFDKLVVILSDARVLSQPAHNARTPLGAQKHIWEGRVEDERMNVTIPVEGPSAEGELHCAAIKDNEGTWVVLVLEAHISRTSLHPEQLLKLQSGDGNALEKGALPPASGAPPSAPDTPPRAFRRHTSPGL